MRFSFDPAKNERNLRQRGISFEQVEDFDFESAAFSEDTRKDYGEKRTRALGYIGNRLHSLVFSARGEEMRVISLRKANRREVKIYEEATQSGNARN